MAPKPFRKPMTAAKFDKRIGKRIYLDTDRAFLSEITVTDGEGNIRLARDLLPDELKRVKKLIKEARKNRGAVRKGKLIILAVVAGAIAVFSLAFRDRLAERTGERLLESVFDAKSELSGVSFRPFRGVVAFDSLTIADSRSPMTNLLEMGRGNLAIRVWPLFSGHFIIDDLTVSDLAFGSPRDSSGEIAVTDSQGEMEDGQDASSSIKTDTFSLADLGLPDTLDATAFVADQMETLSTPGLVEALAIDAEGFAVKWRNEVESATAEVGQISDQVAALAKTDFAAIRSVDDGLRLYAQAESLRETAETLTGRVQRAYGMQHPSHRASSPPPPPFATV